MRPHLHFAANQSGGSVKKIIYVKEKTKKREKHYSYLIVENVCPF